LIGDFDEDAACGGFACGVVILIWQPRQRIRLRGLRDDQAGGED